MKINILLRLIPLGWAWKKQEKQNVETGGHVRLGLKA
jgi:hypothetical protein